MRGSKKEESAHIQPSWVKEGVREAQKQLFHPGVLQISGYDHRVEVQSVTDGGPKNETKKKEIFSIQHESSQGSVETFPTRSLSPS